MPINKDTILSAAQEIKAQIIDDRRALHMTPEVGMELPQTSAYVARRLKELGYETETMCGSGVVATITGEDNGRCILLRADMDALKIEEKAEVPFCAANGNMHACGHDMHAAMLLGAAALLKRFQGELHGTVKLVFQPDEEGFTGAKAMLAAGVLNDPRPQAALALHVNSGTPTGLVLCCKGPTMAGCTLFRIRVTGVGCHGAMPETGVDPLNIAAHILISMQEIIAREIAAKQPAVVTVGKLSGGHAPNIIPQDAAIEGTIRTFDKDLSADILKRIETIAVNTAAAFRGTASVEEIASAYPLRNDPELMGKASAYAAELLGEQAVYHMPEGGMGSEDFAAFSYELPCAYMMIGAGTPQENPMFGKPMHNEAVVFNEDVLPIGAALHTYAAMRWLGEIK